MDPKQFADKMRDISKNTDIEDRHMEADDLLCEMLIELGYAEGVEIYNAMPAWYA